MVKLLWITFRTFSYERSVKSRVAACFLFFFPERNVRGNFVCQKRLTVFETKGLTEVSICGYKNSILSDWTMNLMFTHLTTLLSFRNNYQLKASSSHVYNTNVISYELPSHDLQAYSVSLQSRKKMSLPNWLYVDCAFLAVDWGCHLLMPFCFIWVILTSTGL